MYNNIMKTTSGAELFHFQNRAHCLQQLFEDNRLYFYGPILLINCLLVKKNSVKNKMIFIMCSISALYVK